MREVQRDGAVWAKSAAPRLLATRNRFPGQALSARRRILFERLLRILPADHARDIVQEAYPRFLKYGQPEIIGSPKAYLFRIALNLASERCAALRRDIVIFDSFLLENFIEHKGERTSYTP